MSNVAILFQASDGQMSAFRASVGAGRDARMAYEREKNAAREDGGKSLANIARKLNVFDRRDNSEFAVQYLASHAFDWHNFVTSVKYDGAMCNIYSMTKLPIVAQILNGGSFSSDTCDTRTLAAFVLALAGGVTNGKQLVNSVNDTLTSWGAGRDGAFRNAGTQNGSSARALEALGVISRNGGGFEWHVACPDKMKLLTNAARRFARAKGKNAPAS